MVENIAQIMGNTSHVLEHSLRVVFLARGVIRNLPQDNVTRDQAIDLIIAAMLHDIGKASWEKSWFVKPKQCLVAAGEWEKMQKHPQEAVEILSPLGCIISPIISMIGNHHSANIGYLESILVACDIYSACTESRPYRKQPMSRERAISEAARHAPQCVIDALRKATKEEWAGGENVQ